MQCSKMENNNNNFDISNSIIHVRSDDYSFQKKRITAITVTEENIWDVVHKENDTPEVID